MFNGEYPEIVSMYCRSCGIVFNEEYSPTGFKCSNCDKDLALHVMADDGLKEGHMAFVVPSHEIMDYRGKTVLFNGSINHQIINVNSIQGEKVRVAVKNHTTINCDKDSFWIVIHGGWHKDWPENL